ncbi:MAG: TPR repeat protein [Candidatus Azotimanducaceae bacterium]|jgi:TPR repeat protein
MRSFKSLIRRLTVGGSIALTRVLSVLAGTVVSVVVSTGASANFDVASELYQQQNYVAAFEAFKALAEQGDPKAQTVTALMYKFGEGVEQDFEAAFHWYHKAAEQDYAAAQFHTGSMLADGLGTAPDREAAIDWLNRATRNGFERAIDKLAELNASAAVLGKPTTDLIAWSQNWDLRLPNDLLQGGNQQEPLTPSQSYLVQIGAMSTQASANRLWEVLSSHHPNLFKGLAPIIRLEPKARRVYRVSIGPFDDFREADAFCGRLMASTIQAGCLPIKNN